MVKSDQIIFTNQADGETPMLSFAEIPISAQEIVDATKLLQSKNS